MNIRTDNSKISGFSVIGASHMTSYMTSWDSLMTQMVKNLPAMWENWIQSLGWEDPLEKGMATHFILGILAWSGYSCLENSMDRETWWVIVHGVAKSRARLSD